MKTTQTRLIEFVSQPDTRFSIPVFQRAYVWDGKDCDTLWHDVITAGQNDAEHFIGTILYLQDEQAAQQARAAGVEAAPQVLDVIDGQQRLTTVTLMLAALRNTLVQEAGPDEATARKIEAKYLRVNGDYRLALSEYDRQTLFDIVDGITPPLPVKDEDAGADAFEDYEGSVAVAANYHYFASKMAADGFDAQTLLRGLENLVIISAELEEGDAAQQVFESLNAKGMPLTTGDLVKNCLMADVPFAMQSRFFSEYWKPIQTAFGDDDTGLAAALHGWLALHARHLKIHSKDEVYGAFRTYAATVAPGEREQMLGSLKTFTLAFHDRGGGAPAQWERKIEDGKTVGSKRLFGRA
ncbi:MAG: DUF262 domain-containing protein [Coriobacteriales bacterium]|nr:DUF262 domain-containing protein [Coriobacteriales bacterium]MDY5662485.1 DUF262 domain-containing protein [Coriobacteriales bacterium]